MISYKLPDFDRKHKTLVGDTCKTHGADSAIWFNTETKDWHLDAFPELKWDQMELDKFELALDNQGIKHERIA